MNLRLTGFCLLTLLACADANPISGAGNNKLVVAHYMPWYASRACSGKWGWHWTMNRFDPEHILWDDRREAASHDYPLLGLYDSGDDHVLECHALLMKFAGIRGVVLDWYGTSDHFDYESNHRNAQRLLPWIQRAGLKFAACYEDRALEAQHNAPGASAPATAAQAVRDLQWAQKNWFSNPAYIQRDGRPVLFVFGPQSLSGEQWKGVESALNPVPHSFGLAHLAPKRGLGGVFAWPPVEGGKTLSPEQWQKSLGALYQAPSGAAGLVATAFPGFKDIYAQAGIRPSYGGIAARNGKTLSESLDLALQSRASIVQIATWNDHGEGTAVEPTRQHGYQFLETIQRALQPAGFGPADLRLPVALYQLRKRASAFPEFTAELDAAAALLFESKCIEAEAALARVGRDLGNKPAVFFECPQDSEEDYRLLSDVFYPPGEGLPPSVHQRCRLDFYFPARKKDFATVVWFHGGGLSHGYRSIPQALRRRGVGVVAVNYRLAPESRSPAYIEDAAAACAWAFNHVGKHGGSPEKIFVSGHSAGAYLALMLGLDKRWLAPHGIDPGRIAGMIPLSPQVITHFAIREERGIPEKQPVVDEFAPLFHVRKEAPPCLLITGDRERELLGRYEENAYLWRMLKIAGQKDLSLIELQGYDHGGMAAPAMPLLLRFVERISSTAKQP